MPSCHGPSPRPCLHSDHVCLSVSHTACASLLSTVALSLIKVPNTLSYLRVKFWNKWHEEAAVHDCWPLSTLHTPTSLFLSNYDNILDHFVLILVGGHRTGVWASQVHHQGAPQGQLPNCPDVWHLYTQLTCLRNHYVPTWLSSGNIAASITLASLFWRHHQTSIATSGMTLSSRYCHRYTLKIPHPQPVKLSACFLIHLPSWDFQ